MDCLLPKAELVIENLFIEYVGVDCFADRLKELCPLYISSVIQINEGETFVSDSPCMKIFDQLEPIHCQVGRDELANAMNKLGYANVFESDAVLPNGKRLVRLDLKTGNYI